MSTAGCVALRAWGELFVTYANVDGWLCCLARVGRTRRSDREKREIFIGVALRAWGEPAQQVVQGTR